MNLTAAIHDEMTGMLMAGKPTEGTFGYMTGLLVKWGGSHCPGLMDVPNCFTVVLDPFHDDISQEEQKDSLRPGYREVGLGAEPN